MATTDTYKISINVIGVKGKISEEEDVIVVKVGSKEKKIAPKPQKKALKFPEQNPEATVVLSLQKKSNSEVLGEISFKLNPITFAPAKAVQSSRLKCLFDLKAPGSDTVVGEIRAQISCSLATAEKGKLKHSKQAKSWDIPNGELKFLEQVGEGTSATVWHGKYRGQEVAIKVLKDNMPPKERADFEKEFQILTTLKGSTIVIFYGICQPPPSTYLVLEWCPHGSLHNLLTSSEVFTWTRAIGFCKQMTKALATLHHWDPQIVHRDLKSQNLLVSSSGELKVCDFGLSRATSTPTGGQTTLQKLRGTFQFTAPEIYQLQLYTVKADIYSLGVVLWELFNRLLKGRYEQPFSEYTQFQFDFQIIIQVAKNNLRPSIGENWPKCLTNIIKTCWDKSPDVRPDVDQLMLGINKLEEEYASQKDAWDALIPK